jgi:tRNA threonylcarbamoyladenosine biosynthesis protein TsaB
MKPLALAVDSTAEFGSLALARGGETIEEIPLHAPAGFAQVLFGRARELLERHGLSIREVDCFAAASGPGSFTGVRIGLAFVKGLAEALGKPAVGVSNLRVLAEFGSAALRATVIDARRGEVYGAVYAAGGALVSGEVVGDFGAWAAALPEGDLELIATGFAPFRAQAAGTRLETARWTLAPRALAAAIARLACAAYARGEAPDAAALDANYVRRSDAELYWRE